MRALLLVTSAAALSAPSRRFAELAPLKAAMLAKSWRAKLAEVDQKVGILPDLDGTATGEVGVLRFGPELARRAATGAQLEWLFDAGMGLAGADKSAEPLKARAALAPLVFDPVTKRTGPWIDARALGRACRGTRAPSTPIALAVVLFAVWALYARVVV